MNPTRICSVATCDRSTSRAQEWCEKHYRRHLKHGTTDLRIPPRTDPVQRFWSKVAKGAPDDCWIWEGARFDDGYGAFKVRGERIPNQRAHRYSLRLKLGREIAPGMLACHTCDTPACVNPAHLYEGSPLQNQHDCALRGRNNYGERVERPRRKLTEAQVVEMRHLRAAGATQRALAARYGIGSTTVARITEGSAWARSGGPRTPTTPRVPTR